MKRIAYLLLVLPLALLACGDDDGDGVTSSGAASASSGSGSGAGSASGASGSEASASGSHAATGECVLVGNTEDDAAAEVHVKLSEWAIEADTESVPAGVIAFEAVNEGAEPHELVLVKGATPDQLTIGDEGLDEAALPEGAEVLGEIEGFPSGQTCAGHFELAAGDYSLVCNIVEEHDGEMEAHATEGMVSAFTVT